MSNLPNGNNNQFGDEDSSDDEDYDVPLINLKMKILPNTEQTKISLGHEGHHSNRQGILNETSKVMSGLRCILYGELINGPFILFQSTTQNSHINTICVYNEYFVENKMHHINLSDLTCTLIHADKSILMVLMSTEIYDNVICHGGDISESLNAGASHTLEFLIRNEHERDTMVEDFKLLSIHICKEYYSSTIEEDPLKGCLYKRLLPEVFNIWREVATNNSRDTTTSVELIMRMHVYLRSKANSTFDNTKLFIYPIKGDISLKSEKILKGLTHVQSCREIIAFDPMHHNAEDRHVKGETLQQLIHNASLDDRLICFWFQW